jgi:uncharacterized membrane protein (DUF106 family)
MKLKNKKIFFNSFLLAFIFSFFSILILFPNILGIFYTDIGGKVVISYETLVKAFIVLFTQTSVIGAVFYNIAKKIFLDKERKI